jgi:hypothetical protein
MAGGARSEKVFDEMAEREMAAGGRGEGLLLGFWTKLGFCLGGFLAALV